MAAVETVMNPSPPVVLLGVVVGQISRRAERIRTRHRPALSAAGGQQLVNRPYGTQV